ncbi:hypothetical protein JOQ06_017810 [Pogonophryne albipinna]|uniref:Uncharacterized protein n=1 Tax=Pogonophryne albipinna TaxID=1090488 RepID=A0AAD6AI22_9TELE|nr:hypothetical protein JOQ06_017810 [Pogonophryne albipinna]
MNFVRTRLSLGNLIGQRCRQRDVQQTRGGQSRASSSPSTSSPSTSSPSSPSSSCSCLVQGPRLQTVEYGQEVSSLVGDALRQKNQIPEIVSFEMLDAARNKARVKVCYVMMAVTIGACLITVILGKRAAGRNESLTVQNLEKKARWREEIQREKEAAVALSEKAQ